MMFPCRYGILFGSEFYFFEDKIKEEKHCSAKVGIPYHSSEEICSFTSSVSLILESHFTHREIWDIEQGNCQDKELWF